MKKTLMKTLSLMIVLAILFTNAAYGQATPKAGLLKDAIPLIQKSFPKLNIETSAGVSDETQIMIYDKELQIGKVKFSKSLLENAKDIKIVSENHIKIDGADFGEGQIGYSSKAGKSEMIDGKPVMTFKSETAGPNDEPLSIVPSKGAWVRSTEGTYEVTNSGTETTKVKLPGYDKYIDVPPGASIKFESATGNVDLNNGNGIKKMSFSLPGQPISSEIPSGAYLTYSPKEGRFELNNNYGKEAGSVALPGHDKQSALPIGANLKYEGNTGTVEIAPRDRNTQFSGTFEGKYGHKIDYNTNLKYTYDPKNPDNLNVESQNPIEATYPKGPKYTITRNGVTADKASTIGAERGGPFSINYGFMQPEKRESGIIDYERKQLAVPFDDRLSMGKAILRNEGTVFAEADPVGLSRFKQLGYSHSDFSRVLSELTPEEKQKYETPGWGWGWRSKRVEISSNLGIGVDIPYYTYTSSAEKHELLLKAIRLYQSKQKAPTAAYRP